MKPKPQPAGGYVITSGCAAYPNFLVPQRKPWITAIRRFLQKRVKANDRAVLMMLADAHAEWSTFEPVPYHRFSTLRPIEKAQMMIGHLLRQGRTPLEILACGIAGILMSESGFYPTPPKLPYFRAVQTAQAVRWLHKPEFRVYEREESRTGLVVSTVVNVTAPLRMRSRYACQRVEQIIRKHADPFLREHGPRIMSEMAQKVTAKSEG